MLDWARKKYSRKLGLIFCFAFGLALGLASLLILKNLKHHLVEELRENLALQARQLLLAIPPEAFQARIQDWENFVQKIDRQTGYRVTLIRKDGTVTADSEVAWESLAQMENHAGRPEVAEAFRSGRGWNIRRSSTLNVDLLYVALRNPSQSGSYDIIRLAMPLTRVQKKVGEAGRFVLGSSLTGLLFGLLLVAIGSRWVTQPLAEMTQTVRSMSEGQLKVRASVETQDEVGELARSFNVMTERLESVLDQIQSEKEEFAAILNSMVEHVIALDLGGKILFLNPAAEKLFGVRNQDVVGKSFLEVIRQAPIRCWEISLPTCAILYRALRILYRP